MQLQKDLKLLNKSLSFSLQIKKTLSGVFFDSKKVQLLVRVVNLNVYAFSGFRLKARITNQIPTKKKGMLSICPVFKDEV